jgi:hypothetical protein
VLHRFAMNYAAFGRESSKRTPRLGLRGSQSAPQMTQLSLGGGI